MKGLFPVLTMLSLDLAVYSLILLLKFPPSTELDEFDTVVCFRLVFFKGLIFYAGDKSFFDFESCGL